MGRFPGNPLTRKRQVGVVCTGPPDKPGRLDSDNSLGLLIASGMFERLVPGSPASFYLGCRAPSHKSDSPS